MEKFVIRSASTADLGTLLEFEQGIITAERPYDPTLRIGQISYYDLGALIESNAAEVIVVEHDGNVVASGYAKIKKALPYLDHEEYAYLGFMYTHPDFRGRGLNKKVIDALQKWSKAKGLIEIRLTVYEDNEAAIKAYEKVGFNRHLIEMRLEK